MSLNPKLLSCLSVGREIITPARVKDAAEWAEKYRVLSEFESAIPGRWSNSVTPYAVQPMRALSNPGTVNVTLMCCSQASKSEIVRNALGFWITAAPGPTLWVMPSVAAAEEAVDERLGPMIQNSIPWALPGGRYDISTKKGIKLTSMRIYPATQGSPQALATRPCRYVICDEVDKYGTNAGKDADPLALAAARIRTYKKRGKFVCLSTPTFRDGHIFKRFDACPDQRHYYFPCLKCGHKWHARWEHVVWPKRPEEVNEVSWGAQLVAGGLARIRCPECKHEHEEKHRQAMIQGGEWVSSLGLPEDVFGDSVAFQFSSLVNPWADINKLAEKFLKVRKDPTKLQEFINQEMGEIYEDEIDAASVKGDYHAAKINTYAPGVAPNWTSTIIATADSQKDHFWFTVRAWGRDGRSRLLSHGRANSFEDLRAQTLDAWFDVEGYASVGGFRLKTSCLFIDSGGGLAGAGEGEASITDKVYRFVETDPKRIIPTKGFPSYKRAKKPISESQITAKGARAKHFKQVLLRIVDTQYFKDLLFAKIWDGADWEENSSIDVDYGKQMTAERKVMTKTKSGLLKLWKQTSHGSDNHFWDCAVLQIAAADYLKVHLSAPLESLHEERLRLAKMRQAQGIKLEETPRGARATPPQAPKLRPQQPMKRNGQDFLAAYR